jgi:D-glycero-D-manno-heptose 1,7-bisphosphate phosphatase
LTVVFVDRDGVINVNRHDYVKTVDEFEFVPGALEGLARLKNAGITAVVVSNQAGVGRGLIDPAELERINEKMRRAVVEHGGEIAGIYYCVHRKDEGCDCRKPGIGLLLQASADMDFPLGDAYFIGDAESDVEAGRKAGCQTIFVLTGRTSADQIQTWNCRPDYVADDLPAAVDHILARERDKR